MATDWSKGWEYLKRMRMRLPVPRHLTLKAEEDDGDAWKPRCEESGEQTPPSVWVKTNIGYPIIFDASGIQMKPTKIYVAMVLNRRVAEAYNVKADNVQLAQRFKVNDICANLLRLPHLRKGRSETAR